MRIANTFDEVLFAALQAGLEPDDQDVAQVRVPPGEDPATFTASMRLAARRVVDARRNGLNDQAREIAATAQTEYLAKFEALAPIPAGQDEDSLDDLGSRMFRR